MAFVRAKRRGSRMYYQLVTNDREGGRVRQRVLAYLGSYTSVEAALAGLPGEIAHRREHATRCRARAEAYRARVPASWLERNGGEVPQLAKGSRNNLRRNYWWWAKRAAAAEQWAGECETRLEQVQALTGGGTP